MSNDDFFVGYLNTPKADKRFFLKAGLGLVLATGASAAGLAAVQNRPGKGTWDQGAEREWTGIVTADPYAMLRTADLDGSPQTVLLSCLGKCGVAAQIGALEGKPVKIRGSLIQRGEHAMIAVAETTDWIEPLSTNIETTQLQFPEREFLTDVSLSGEILDTKCWFGAMRPSSGKVHKACAALCIRGGLPPAFFAKDKQGNHALMIMTVNEGSFSDNELAYVADPVSVAGKVYVRGNILQLDTTPDQIQRV